MMMGNCLKAKTAVENKTNKIIISVVGLDDSGKSTTVKVLKGDKDINETAPTVGYEPHELTYNSKDIIVYDLGGGSRVRDIWKHYLAESFGFVYVVDSSNRSRVNETRSVFASFVENEKVAGKPILILGNKQDQANALDESEIVQYLNVEELVNKFQIPCRVETCTAVTGTGNKIDKSLKSGFDWLYKHITVNLDELRTRIDHDVQKQKSEESRIRREKHDRVRQKRENDPSYYDNDDDQIDKNENPWKKLDEMKVKDTSSKSKTSSLNSTKLSAYERQLIDEMETSGSRARLTTISEENKSKLRGLKNNKLAPYDDKLEEPIKPKSNPTWAQVDTQSKKSNLPAIPYRSKYDVF